MNTDLNTIFITIFTRVVQKNFANTNAISSVHQIELFIGQKLFIFEKLKIKKMNFFFIAVAFLNIEFIAIQDVTFVGDVKKAGETINFDVVSNKKFYFGNNIHYLHIGKKIFQKSKQTDKIGESKLTFFISSEDFNSLIENDEMWISYGNKISANEIEKHTLQKVCEANSSTMRYLGKFTKSLLK